VRSDAAIGIVFTAFFSIGVIALSVGVENAHIDTACVLFGDVLGISNDSLILLGITAPAVMLLVGLFYRWLSLVSFDKGLAANLGVPVALVHYGLMGAVSVTSVASFEAIGAILAIAMIVVPAATAHILCDRLPWMLIVACAHGVFSAILGMYFAVWLDVSAAGAMVCVGGVLYALAFLGAPKHGVLVRWARRRARGSSTATSTTASLTATAGRGEPHPEVS
jgi:manganese/zinc/iron transport system permease protein